MPEKQAKADPLAPITEADLDRKLVGITTIVNSSMKPNGAPKGTKGTKYTVEFLYEGVTLRQVLQQADRQNTVSFAGEVRVDHPTKQTPDTIPTSYRVSTLLAGKSTAVTKAGAMTKIMAEAKAGGLSDEEKQALIAMLTEQAAS